MASLRRIPESTVQINCVLASLLCGSGSDVGVVPGEGAVTDDCSGAAGGVITVGGDGAVSEDGEGAASGVNGGVGAVPGDAGVQLATSSNSEPKIIPMYLIYMPSVQDKYNGIITHELR